MNELQGGMGNPLSYLQAQGGLIGGNAAGSLSNAVTIPQEKRPQIQAAIEELQKELAFHGEQLVMLHQRLEPLMSLDPGKESGANEANETTCMLAASMRKATRDLVKQSNLLCQILRRLEI